jgi:hypothetical protein
MTKYHTNAFLHANVTNYYYNDAVESISNLMSEYIMSFSYQLPPASSSPCYHSLYLIACDKDVMLSDYLVSSGNSSHCNPSFMREVQDWELEPLDSFLNLLYYSRTHPGKEDKMLWSPASSHGFEVKNYYKILEAGKPFPFP